MSMYNDYDFTVEAVHPSGLLSYQSGRGTTQRKFKVPCENAEEFALRMMGKFYRDGETPYFLRPIIPVPFPFDPLYGTTGHFRGFLNLVATSFQIEPLSSCCFNSDWSNESGSQTSIQDPTAYAQLERYFSTDVSADNSECMCYVTIGYEENPCDCAYYDYEGEAWVTHAEILPGTCVSTERNPAYEIFTLPNANLVWKNILSDQGEQVQLKADSYAYQIIPKADIIVSWHNVPVQALCQIESHLVSFRGKVNQEEWGDSILCNWVDPTNLSNDDRIDCAYYEPETILFVDWQEDRSKRTDAFGGNTQDGNSNMNTTTLKLFFKQKRVEFPGSNSNSVSDDDDPDGDGLAIAGWNHLFTDNDISTNSWRRVVVKSTQEPVFRLRAFSDIMYPVL